MCITIYDFFTVWFMVYKLVILMVSTFAFQSLFKQRKMSYDVIGKSIAREISILLHFISFCYTQGVR